MRRTFVSLLAVLTLLAGFVPQQAKAGGMPPLIRDAEMERTLREYTVPIFKAAGLDPLAVHVFILQSDEINAFVAGGENLFIIPACWFAPSGPGS